MVGVRGFEPPASTSRTWRNPFEKGLTGSLQAGNFVLWRLVRGSPPCPCQRCANWESNPHFESCT